MPMSAATKKTINTKGNISAKTEKSNLTNSQYSKHSKKLDQIDNMLVNYSSAVNSNRNLTSAMMDLSESQNTYL